MPSHANEMMPHATLAADLTALAAEPAPEKRLELLRRITDAYADHADQCTAAERFLFDEVVTKLIDKVASDGRAKASAKLSKLPQLPDGLVQKLALDGDIEVAWPIIRDYGALAERILIAVASNGSQEHLHAIAGRPVVTPPVSDVVVTRGDRRTIQTLAANRGVQFSEFGIQRLIDKSHGDGALQALIVARSDLPLTAIGKLLPLISEELANRLREVAVPIDDATIENHLTAWTADRQKSAARTEAYIDGIKSGDLNANDILLELLTGKRLLCAATVLASIIGLDRSFAANVLTGGKVQSALLLLRALDLPWKVAEAFVVLRAAKAGLHDYETPPTRTNYEDIDIATAQRVVRFMKVRRVAKSG